VEYYGKVLGRTLDYNDYGDSWFGLRYCYECCSLCWELMIDDNCLEITPTLLLL
jgi:hypothetical protein